MKESGLVFPTTRETLVPPQLLHAVAQQLLDPSSPPQGRVDHARMFYCPAQAGLFMPPAQLGSPSETTIPIMLQGSCIKFIHLK